jgi:hypothetical protein
MRSISYGHGQVCAILFCSRRYKAGADCSISGGNGITSDKVPTEISYKLDLDTKPIANVTPEQNPMAGAPTTVRWGFMHKPNESRIKCMKLFLDRNQKLPHFVNHSNLLYLAFRTSLTSFAGQPAGDSYSSETM